MGKQWNHKSKYGVIYLIHFERPYKGVQHYMGWVMNGEIGRRMLEHEEGNGKSSPLIRAVQVAGIAWTVVRTWKGTRNLERQLKKTKNSPRMCPLCNRGQAMNYANDPKWGSINFVLEG